MSDHLAFGILGVAGIARRQLIPAIRKSRNARAVAIASRDAERAADAAREFRIRTAHASYQALLDDPDVAAVYVPLPNSLHREWTIRAAEAGKHVLCEKPLARDAAEAEEMIAACRQHGVAVMEAFMYRFHPRTVEVARLAREGAVGTVRLVRAAFTFRVASPANIRLSAPLGGGALMDVGCYGVNASRMVLGEPVGAAAAMVRAPGGVDETTVATLRFPGGALGVVDCSVAAAPRQWYEVIGDEGVIAVPHAFRPDLGSPVIEIRRGGALERRRFPRVNQYVLMVEAFADAVLSGGPVPLAPDDALANMRALDLIRAASP